MTRLKVRIRAKKVSCDHGEKLGGSRVGCGGSELFNLLTEPAVRTEARDVFEPLCLCNEAAREDVSDRIRFCAGSARVVCELATAVLALGEVVGACGDPKRLSRSL